jgi:hypothetical protein
MKINFREYRTLPSVLPTEPDRKLFNQDDDYQIAFYAQQAGSGAGGSATSANQLIEIDKLSEIFGDLELLILGQEKIRRNPLNIQEGEILCANFESTVSLADLCTTVENYVANSIGVSYRVVQTHFFYTGLAWQCVLVCSRQP